MFIEFVKFIRTKENQPLDKDEVDLCSIEAAVELCQLKTSKGQTRSLTPPRQPCSSGSLVHKKLTSGWDMIRDYGLSTGRNVVLGKIYLFSLELNVLLSTCSSDYDQDLLFTSEF